MSETPAETPAQEPNAPTEPQQPAPEPTKGEETDWKTEARKWEQRAKDNNKAAQERDELKSAQQQQLDAIAQTLGLKGDDSPPNLAALTSQIETEKGARQAAERDLAVYRVAADPDIGANALRLLDSTRFRQSIKDIDPTDTDALTAAVKAAVESDEVFKATQSATTPPFPGGPRPPAPQRAGSLGEAIAGRLSSNTR